MEPSHFNLQVSREKSALSLARFGQHQNAARSYKVRLDMAREAYKSVRGQGGGAVRGRACRLKIHYCWKIPEHPNPIGGGRKGHVSLLDVLCTLMCANMKASNCMLQTWALEDGCLLSSIAQGEFMVRHKGVSSLWSMARGHYTKAILVRFCKLSIASPPAFSVVQ